jgi:citrate lyase subunit beta/citryl-CoA lyase
MVTLDALRTALFVPATRPDRFAKAASSGADAIILDLEDAVLPDDKDAARANLRAGFDCPVIVRINAAGTPWHKADCAAVAALDCAAVMVPKAEDPETLRRVTVDTPNGPVSYPAPAALFDGAARSFGAVPALAPIKDTQDER